MREDTVQDRIDRARKDVDSLKSTQFIGADSSKLFITSLSASYVIPGPSNPSYHYPYFVEITFTSDNQINPFANLDYATTTLNSFPIDHIQKKVSNDDSKVTKFWAFFINNTGTDITVDVTWYIMSTDTGTIT